MATCRDIRPVAACEPLEHRLMFFTYQVTGTSGSDAISLTIVGNSIISAVNGVSDSGSDPFNNHIEINSLGGSDTISIIKHGANSLTVNAGSGNDTINFSPGERDLDAMNLEETITVNGDGDSDTVILFDDNETALQTYNARFGNVIGRSGALTVTANVESVVVRGGSGSDFFAVLDPPTFALSVHGRGGTEVLNLFGEPDEIGTYSPSGLINGSGTIDFGGSTINFQTMETIRAIDFGELTVRTPNPNDSLIVTADGVISGSSSGVAITLLSLTNVAELNLDLALNDNVSGNDSVLIGSGANEMSLIRIDAGVGLNTLTSAGTVTIDTGVGTNAGNNLAVINSGGELTFDGAQSLKRLEVNSGGVVRFNGGVGNLLSTQALAVAAGTGTIDLAQNQNVTVPVVGTFSIGAGGTLVEKGFGNVSVFGAQTHAAGALLRVENGSFNLHSDAGTPTAHPLSLLAIGGLVNLASTQHFTSVAADGGNITMLANGSRVLVTNSVATGAEGGTINLRDNDMIVDYSSRAEVARVADLLFNGRRNGAWDGLGINSSSAAADPAQITTLGSMEAADFKGIYGANATFDGQPLDDTALLIKFTYYGDADFSGRVTNGDFQRVLLGNSPDWTDGDFDDNGTVDQDDVDLINAAFGAQGPAL